MIPVTTKDEIGFLTTEFNRLFERLKAYDQLNMEKLLTEREKVHQSELAKARFSSRSFTPIEDSHDLAFHGPRTIGGKMSASQSKIKQDSFELPMRIACDWPV